MYVAALWASFIKCHSKKRSPGTLVSGDVWFSQKSPGEGTLNKSAAINLRGDRDEPVYNEIH